MFNYNNQSKHNTIKEGTSHEDINIQFQAYLKVASSKSKGVRCRLGIGNDGVIDAVVWTSSPMRCNFEIFGSYICIDAMKRVLNKLKWHAFQLQ